MSNTKWNEILGWGSEEMEDLRFVGFSYIQQGQYDIAISFFQALCILEPKNAYDLQMLGALYLQKGNGLAALENLDKSLKIEPNHFGTLLNRCKTLFLLGYTKQGLQQAEELKKCEDGEIAKQATALLLSYS